jgi:hypothetical protein
MFVEVLSGDVCLDHGADVDEGHQKEADKGDTEDRRDDGSGVNRARSDPEKLRKAARAGFLAETPVAGITCCRGVHRLCWWSLPMPSSAGSRAAIAESCTRRWLISIDPASVHSASRTSISPAVGDGSQELDTRRRRNVHHQRTPWPWPTTRFTSGMLALDAVTGGVFFVIQPELLAQPFPPAA